jgi:hypothetical protein
VGDVRGVSGTVTYEWMEGGFFLIQRVDLEQYGQGVGGHHLLGEVLVIQQLQGEPLGVGEPVNDGGLEVLGELDPERSVPPCILVVVVENAADNAGVTGRCLLGPSFAETARKHGSSRSPSIGGARTVARAAATLAEPVSARPGANDE